MGTKMAPGLPPHPALIHPSVMPSPSPEQSLVESPHPVKGSGGVKGVPKPQLGFFGPCLFKWLLAFPIPLGLDGC